MGCAVMRWSVLERLLLAFLFAFRALFAREDGVWDEEVQHGEHGGSCARHHPDFPGTSFPSLLLGFGSPATSIFRNCAGITDHSSLHFTFPPHTSSIATVLLLYYSTNTLSVS